MIRSGDTFQSLINTLLQFEYPGTRVFGRSGKDAGQDACSPDAKIVYQYKYHTNASFAKTLADANGELTKIKKYRTPAHDTIPAHEHYDLWKNAREWVLVTNVTVNPNNLKDWDTDIAPAFEAVGLKVTLLGLEQLDALLVKYPDVKGAYFEGENRCFLSLSEAYEFTKADELGEAGLKVALIGRASELDRVDDFLNGTKKLLCVHGPGGIGKSRLLLEIGERAENAGKQVLWGLEATMSKSSQWFKAIPSCDSTLLIIDEPQDPDVIRVISEQVRSPSPQLQGLKVVIAVRSPNDPILKAIADLSGALKDNSIILDPLSTAQAKELGRALIETTTLKGLTENQKENIAARLSQIGSRYPIWIAMAVSVLAEHGDLTKLPTSQNELAKKYLDEVINRSISSLCSKEQLLELVRWLAIYEEIDVEESPTLSFLARQIGFPDATRTLECLNSLVARRFVVRRGLNNRLFSIKPDVMRDYVVQDWLIAELDGHIEPRPASQKLVSLLINGHDQKPLPHIDSLIKSLAKAEYLTQFQGEHLDFLSPLIEELEKLARNGTVLQQQAIFRFLNCFDFARLEAVLQIIKTLRLSKKPDAEFKDFFGHTHKLTHNDVICQLAWPLFNAARYARAPEERRAILDEMAAISCVEATLNLPRTDGNRADALIPRMISNENNRYQGYDDDAFKLVTALSAKLDAPDVDEATMSLFKTLCDPFLSLEWERTLYSQHAITVERGFNAIQSPAGERRNELREKIRSCLVSCTGTVQNRLILWKLLSNAHSSASRRLLHVGDNVPETIISDILSDIEKDLIWLLDWIKTTECNLAELKAARALWQWHLRFDKDEKRKELASACEAIYQQHPLVSAFHVFFSHELYEQAREKAREFGDKFGRTGSSREIREFLRQAQEFSPERTTWGSIMEIAAHAAAHWDTNKDLAAFANAALRESPDGIEFTFVTNLLDHRFRLLRKAGDYQNLAAELNNAAQGVPSKIAAVKLVSSLFGRPHPLVSGVLTLTDLQFVREQLAANGELYTPSDKCYLLAGMYHVDWEGFKKECEGFFNEALGEERLKCFLGALRGMHFLDLFNKTYPELAFTAEGYNWILHLMLKLPDLDEVEDLYELTQLVERFGRKDSSWLFGAIETRIEMAAAQPDDGAEDFKVIPTRNRLTRYVNPINDASAVSEGVRNLMGALLNYSERKDTIGYIVPRYAAEVDPAGLIMPGLIVARIQSAGNNKELIWNWARFAGYYGFGFPAWQIIARATVAASEQLPTRDRDSIYVLLLPQELKSSSYPVGEMDPRPGADLQLRKQELANETDDTLLLFRQWHLAMAQSEFDQMVARYREENEQ
jgi:hypothetical protein